MRAHIHARMYNIIINREGSGTDDDEGGPYFTEKFDKSARVLRFLQPYPPRTNPPPQPHRASLCIHTRLVYVRTYIYIFMGRPSLISGQKLLTGHRC